MTEEQVDEFLDKMKITDPEPYQQVIEKEEKQKQKAQEWLDLF